MDSAITFEEDMKLDLVWTAHFTNGIVNQFDDMNNQVGEHLFKEILERKDKLTQFTLFNINSSHVYSVDLLNGRINTYIADGRENTTPEVEVSGDGKYSYRLIYFRRVSREVEWSNAGARDLGVKDIKYFLGFQYQNEAGENIKRLMQITKEDETYLA